MENGVIEAYVTNLGKYNEGELVGEWVKFPISKEEMSAVLDRIGIGAEYEEIFITDYDTSLYGVSSQLGEYENLDKLNYLAGVIAELDSSDREKYEAVLESGLSLGQNGIDGLINLAYNLDNYDMLPGVEDEDDLGRYYAEIMYGENLDEKMGELAHYIDFERYGSDCQINDGGMFTDKGYMRETGATWDKYFDGSLEDIPDEYRLGEQVSEVEAKYSIYQLKRGEDMRDYSFASMDMLDKLGLTVNPDNYEKVYEAPKTAEDTLDSIYYRFNMEHPADFRGHSLSVSDVIVFHENGVDTAHYVDSYGFTAIPDFVTAKELTVDMNTVGLTVEGHDGTWHSMEELSVQGNTFYLMESETYGQDANMIVVDHAGELVAEDITAEQRANVREIVNEVLNEKIEAMAVELVPDRTITPDEMVEYGYEWGGMIPLREQAAEKLYDAGLEIFVLNQDNSEASIDSKDYLTDHAERGGIFGVEKVAWAKFVETNSLKKVEELLEDDYGMIDGIINNGSKQEKEDKAHERKGSVIEKLSEGKEAVKKYDKEKSHEPKTPSRPDREI